MELMGHKCEAQKFTYDVATETWVSTSIRGVMDIYTDPQIHSHDGAGFGSGNMGAEGVNRFLQTHACTSECQALDLPPLHAGESDEQLARRLQFGEIHNQRRIGDRGARAERGGGLAASSSSSDNSMYFPRAVPQPSGERRTSRWHIALDKRSGGIIGMRVVIRQGEMAG
eukprot:868704-Prorocentrum_minimum.AAC.2